MKPERNIAVLCFDDKDMVESMSKIIYGCINTIPEIPFERNENIIVVDGWQVYHFSTPEYLQQDLSLTPIFEVLASNRAILLMEEELFESAVGWLTVQARRLRGADYEPVQIREARKNKPTDIQGQVKH